MIAALSATSAQGIWILTTADGAELVNQVTWSDAESTALSSKIAGSFAELMTRAGVSPLTRLFCVSGPGAFTGLRMSSAFIQGLGRALNIPVNPIPTFDLYGGPVWLPLRHQKARSLTLEMALNQNIEFLRLDNAEHSSLGTPAAGELTVGLADSPLWPDADCLWRGMRQNLASPRNFEINYGLEPKISGVRKD